MLTSQTFSEEGVTTLSIFVPSVLFWVFVSELREQFDLASQLQEIFLVANEETSGLCFC